MSVSFLFLEVYNMFHAVLVTVEKTEIELCEVILMYSMMEEI